MNRAMRRRSGAPKERTYTLTESQIQAIRNEESAKAVDTAFTLMLALPLEVLIGEGYWEKTAKKRLPKFLDEVLGLYDAYNAGVIKIEYLREELREYGGIELSAPRNLEHE